MHPFRVVACLFAASLALSVGPVHAHQGRITMTQAQGGISVTYPSVRQDGRGVISVLWPAASSQDGGLQPYILVRSPQESVVGVRVLPASLASPLAPLLNSLARLSTGWEGVTGEFAVSRSVATTLEVRFSWPASALPARDDQRVCLSAQLKVPNDTGAVVRPFVVTSAKPSAPLPGGPGQSGRGKPGT